MKIMKSQPGVLVKKSHTNSQLSTYKTNMKIQIAQQIRVAGNIGRIYCESNQIAIDCYLKIIKSNPSKPANYFNLALLLQKSKRTEQAIEYYKMAVSLDPTNANFYFHLANAYSENQKIYNAIDSYYRVICYNPNSLQSYQKLVILFKKVNNLKEASHCYSELFRIIIQSLWFLLQSFHKVKAKQKVDYVQSQIYEKMQKSTIDLQVLYCLGTSLSDIKKFEESVDCYHQAEKLLFKIGRLIKSFGLNWEDVVNFPVWDFQKFKGLWFRKGRKALRKEALKKQISVLLF